MTDYTAETCRILLVSSSLQQALSFADRVKAESSISNDPSDPPNSSRTIPWKIVNKYYTADVHFEAHEVRQWSSRLVDGVPAVIFVWSQGEPYKDHAQYISKELASHEPEVSLAVRIQSLSHKASDDDEDLDEFLSSLGFEFIDVSSGTSRDNKSDGVDLLSEGIPGLPRVVDALSTIMWPSMVQSQSTTKRKSKARELLDWAREEEEEDGLRALVDSGRPNDDHSTSDSAEAQKKSRMQKEMEELERWLQEDEVIRASGDPWVDMANIDDGRSLVSPLGVNDSPVGMQSSFPEPWKTTDSAQQSGFDDDFTVFVSAPAPTTADAGSFASGRSSPNNASYDSDRLDPMFTGASYRSLGSVSDFGESREHGNDDPELPSDAEIQATSARIFGSTLSTSASPQPSLSRNLTAHLRKPTSPDSVSTPMPTSTSFSNSDDLASDEEEDYEVGNFDLSRVLNTLQNMKEEIAGMENEDERRRAAARAALGLVYGLERQGNDDDGGPM